MQASLPGRALSAALFLVLGAVPGALGAAQDAEAHERGLATITEDDARAHVEYLASPELEGRDTPSRGLDLAAIYLHERFAAAGVAPLAGRIGYRWDFPIGPRPPLVHLYAPVPEECSLALLAGEGVGQRQELVYGDDFVPLPLANGQAEGPLSFVGFGIRTRGYDDLRVERLEGSIAMLFEGEPEHPKKFEGPEVTEDADVYAKLEELAREGAVGALIVRRRPGPTASESERDGGASSEEAPDEDEAEPPPAPQPGEPGPVPDAPKALGFRSTWSVWNEPNPSFPRADSAPLPALEISRAAASRLLGADVDVLLAEMDADAKPLRLDPSPRRVHLRAESRTSDSLSAPNVVGVVPGSDPAFAKEFVIVGAHLDHIGVDTRGRLGLGADDNASGIAVVIEVAEAIALARPKRSVVFCAFSGEEDGLVGSYVFARDMQLDKNEVVAMLNADMVGRGPTDTLATLGVKQNPALEKLLKRAQKLSNTGIKKLSFDKAQHLWERSDHYSFHELGIPTLFFFEDPRGESKNPDYHTWRDTVELVDHDKVARTARLVFNAAWLLANDEERPPRPGR